MTVHDFGKQLDYSHHDERRLVWQEVYTRAFPDMAVCLDLRHDGWHQRAGRDRAVILTSGRMIYVDEKVRSQAYDDILIEVWSTYPRNGRAPFPPVPGANPGWGVKPLDCDFLAYAFEPYPDLLPVPVPRRARRMGETRPHVDREGHRQ